MFSKNLSLLLCYVSANFLDFIRVLTTYVFSALCLLEGNVVSVNKFSNMRMMRNDEYIIVCTFGGRRMSSFEVIEEEPQAPTPSWATVVGSEKKKKRKVLPERYFCFRNSSMSKTAGKTSRPGLWLLSRFSLLCC